MGAAEVIPGVSSGTIAMALKIYEQFIRSLSQLFTSRWKESVIFLLPLIMGMAVAVISLVRVVKWLLAYYPNELNVFFVGLIAGIIPYLWKKARPLKLKHMSVLFLLFIIFGVLQIVTESNSEIIHTIQKPSDYVVLVLLGFLSSAAMIMPGVSGSLILLLFGYYYTVLNAATIFHFPTLIAFGTGVGIGVITVSKLISFLFSNFQKLMYAIIIGLLLSSIMVLFPMERERPFLSFIIFIVGFGVIFRFNR